MSDLVSGLLNGNAEEIAEVIVAIIAALVIWRLVHSATAPDTRVKVLWGLVEYTKRPTLASSDLKAPTVASSDLKVPTVPPPAARDLTPTEQAAHDALVAEWNAPAAEPVQEETPDERFVRARG